MLKFIKRYVLCWLIGHNAKASTADDYCWLGGIKRCSRCGHERKEYHDMGV